MAKILIACAMVLIAACSAPSLESNLATDTAGSNANCFTSLNPAGTVKDGMFTEVHFYNGTCTGETQALNKLAMKTDVLVIRGSDRLKSPLYLRGKDVSVQMDGETIVIGKMVSDGDTESLELADQVGFDLMVSDGNGNTQAWKYGDQATSTQEEIAVFL